MFRKYLSVLLIFAIVLSGLSQTNLVLANSAKDEASSSTMRLMSSHSDGWFENVYGGKADLSVVGISTTAIKVCWNDKGLNREKCSIQISGYNYEKWAQGVPAGKTVTFKGLKAGNTYTFYLHAADKAKDASIVNQIGAFWTGTKLDKPLVAGTKPNADSENSFLVWVARQSYADGFDYYVKDSGGRELRGSVDVEGISEWVAVPTFSKDTAIKAKIRVYKRDGAGKIAYRTKWSNTVYHLGCPDYDMGAYDVQNDVVTINIKDQIKDAGRYEVWVSNTNPKAGYRKAAVVKVGSSSVKLKGLNKSGCYVVLRSVRRVNSKKEILFNPISVLKISFYGSNAVGTKVRVDTI